MSDFTDSLQNDPLGDLGEKSVAETVPDLQTDSLGATYQDEIDIMVKYGAVNALNLDGGTSSAMYLNGERVNGTAAITGTRSLPCAVLVAPKE